MTATLLPQMRHSVCPVARRRKQRSKRPPRRHRNKLANDGRDTRSIQHYLGHRSIASTARYTALAPDQVLRISGKIDAQSKPPPSGRGHSFQARAKAPPRAPQNNLGSHAVEHTDSTPVTLRTVVIDVSGEELERTTARLVSYPIDIISVVMWCCAPTPDLDTRTHSSTPLLEKGPGVGEN